MKDSAMPRQMVGVRVLAIDKASNIIGISATGYDYDLHIPTVS